MRVVAASLALGWGRRMLLLCAPFASTAASLALGKGTAGRGSLRRRGGRCGRRVSLCSRGMRVCVAASLALELGRRMAHAAICTPPPLAAACGTVDVKSM